MGSNPTRSTDDMKDEAGMWRYLSPKVRSHGMFTRIETRETASGVPDVDAFLEDFGAVKIELKICKDIKRGFTLRPAQHRFMQDRLKVGDRRVWILACIDDKSVSQKPRWMLIHGSSSRQLIEGKTVANWMNLSWWNFHGYLDDADVVNNMMETIKNEL